ncbi:hypothetical protein BJY04DRAFT_231955 [Aspergillus karnatakaensis]|uniref:uncharacterized protein n=1 Tax=Aspergillus karnatakaensis TaxID=1810916 RepID=UPI003CCC98ED
MLPAADQTLRSPTTFEQAITAYLVSLPDKKGTKRMFFDGLATAGQVNPEWIQNFILEAERKVSQKSSRAIFSTIVRPMIVAVKAYYGVLDTMCQTNPLPAAIIWGSLKIFLDSAYRVASLLETIKQQLQDLTFHLERISFFDQLFKDPPMQQLLCRSYINVLRFWTRVRKECERSMLSLFIKSTGPFSTSKIDSIIVDLQKDAEEISNRADMLEKGRAQTERDVNAHRRLQDDMDRKGSRAVPIMPSPTILMYLLGHRYDRARQWLGANYRRHSTNLASHVPGTSEWVLDTDEFQNWISEKPDSPVLWMSGNPGTGKSMLCSRTIQHIQNSNPSTAVAFHFFMFDQEAQSIDLLRVMTGQLIDTVRQSTQDLPGSIVAITETLGASVDNIMDMMNAITSSGLVEKTFLFIDGLDEELSERRWATARDTLLVLIRLVESNPAKSTRLWISSQAHNAILRMLGHYPRLHLVDQNEKDIRLLFDKGMQALEEELDEVGITAEERGRWVDLLKEKAKGNLLWAHYMIQSIAEEAESVADIEKLILHGLPKDLNGYYARQFKRIPASSRDLASKILSVVCFSRRPVTVGELSDAIGVLRNPSASSKSEMDRRRPRSKLLHNLLSPLIVEEQGYSGTEKRYRLFHSTVKVFMKENPKILCERDEDARDASICPSVLAELCLQYLSQPPFSSLLDNVDGRWQVANGSSLDGHEFLSYAAKYWYYHLEDVPSVDLAEKIATFLKSANFQTLLQTQHIFVDSQFGVFTIAGKPSTSKFFKRSLPQWFVRMTARNPDMHFCQDYRVFLHEWSYLLACGCCENPGCTGVQYAGQIDRCIFGTLGDNNFMSGMRSRYAGFALTTSDKNGIRTSRRCYEGYSACGRVVYLLQFESFNPPLLYFTCETWDLNQRIEVDEREANVALYFTIDETDLSPKPGTTKTISFDYDALSLRIGSQLYLRGADGIFQKGLGYFEDFVTQGKYVSAGESDESPVQDVVRLFNHSWQDQATDDVYKSDEDGSPSELDSTYASTSSSSPGEPFSSGDETWSEASTHVEAAIHDENAIIFFRGYNTSSESSEDAQSGPSSSDNDPSDAESDDIGLGMNPFSHFLRGYVDDESDGDDAYVPLEELEHQASRLSRYSRAFRRKPKESDLRASLKVFSRSESGLKCIFQFSKPLHLLLYNSPPVLHPTKPLIIWPMSPGNLLFVDFEQKTWFMRRLRPTTNYTRQVFTKCHFSECGKYLHVAVLKARRKPAKRPLKKSQAPSGSSKERDLPPLDLALFVSTRRLSSRKTTRAPPTQIHRTKVDLGHFHTLPVSQLPFTVTWTSSHLYFTTRKRTLQVFKISLFPTRDGESSVLVPKEKVFLPASVKTREVRFFCPPDAVSEPAASDCRVEKTPAMRVLIGSHLRSSHLLLGESTADPTSIHGDEDGGFQIPGTGWVPHIEAIRGVEGSVFLPVGFYIEREEDFGGWVGSESVVDIPADKGVGQLDVKIERFDVDEDCDLEPYII